MKLKFPSTRLCQFSAPSCDRFGRHGEWKNVMATKIITKVAKLASVQSVKRFGFKQFRFEI